MIVTTIYALLFYLAAASFFGGIFYKLLLYARTPQSFKIPTTPAPITRVGVGWRLFKETVFFESLFKANKWLWFFGWIFHAALIGALIHHLGVFFDGVYTPPDVLVNGALLIGLAGLWARRFLIDRIRYISALSDHLMLALLAGIVITGVGMRYLDYPSIVEVKQFFLGLLYLHWKPLPAQPLLLAHLALVALLMMIFPISKLMHAPGLFFSPTRNQPDNAREKI